ncbi:MAG: TIGR00282 family metallophosphoesterase [Clostridiales bacterium]|nr:TIGR00282 family metallophosphoesterase [Clostridiales bacterium]
MRILAVGDVVSFSGREFIYSFLSKIKEKYEIDFCVVNGENSANTNGITSEIAKKIFESGADVVTLGNHAFSNKGIFQAFDSKNLIRPINYPPKVEGAGYVIFNLKGLKILVVNVLGRALMNLQLDCPFRTVNKLFWRINKMYDISVLDFHAETTSEKIAFANYFDSRINIIFGTHTHIQTADERVLPGGTGYITDLGMTGVVDSVIGVKKEIIINSFLTGKKYRFEKAVGDACLCGAIFDINPESKNINSIERIVVFKEDF